MKYVETWKGRYTRLKASAKARGYTVALGPNEYRAMTETGKCYYCKVGDLPRVGHGLDRRDPDNLDYSLTNAVPCCTTCNLIKGAYLTDAQYKILVAGVSGMHNEQEDVWFAIRPKLEACRSKNRGSWKNK